MKVVTRDWLAQRKACGPDLRRALATFGESIPVSAETMTRAEELGLNLLWLGCQMADEAVRREFVAFTLEQRLPALERLLEKVPPPGRKALRAAAATAWRRWAETEDIEARSLATALREAARDMGVRRPTPGQAQEAALAAQRAVSYAGMDQEAARQEQLEWLAGRLIG